MAVKQSFGSGYLRNPIMLRNPEFCIPQNNAIWSFPSIEWSAGKEEG
jgi:hypothetical protein